MKNIVISPPFGTHINVSWATSVLGTFTYDRRPGSRIWRAIKTLRPIYGGWVNNIGLINPGLSSMIIGADPRCNFFFDLWKNPDSAIVSVHGENDESWRRILYWIEGNGLQELWWELNFSCPNVGETYMEPETYDLFANTCPNLIIKLPPDDNAVPLMYNAAGSGIQWFHCCNTIKTDRGGESGRKLKELNLPIIEALKYIDTNIKIIGGGGIYTPRDVDQYYNAGADKVSLSTIWFTPWRVPKVKKRIEERYGK